MVANGGRDRWCFVWLVTGKKNGTAVVCP